MSAESRGEAWPVRRSPGTETPSAKRKKNPEENKAAITKLLFIQPNSEPLVSLLPSTWAPKRFQHLLSQLLCLSSVCSAVLSVVPCAKCLIFFFFSLRARPRKNPETLNTSRAAAEILPPPSRRFSQVFFMPCRSREAFRCENSLPPIR